MSFVLRKQIEFFFKVLVMPGISPNTVGPFIKPNKQMLEASGKKKKIPYKKGPTFKIKIKIK